MSEPLRHLRYKRTAAATRVMRLIRHCLSDPAPFVRPDGLPSWWPFWSDTLVDAVRDAYRAATVMAAAEAEGTR